MDQFISAVNSIDHGEFVTVGSMRVRLNQILAYSINFPIKDEQGTPLPFMPGLGLVFANGTTRLIPAETQEEAEKLLAQLDWLVRKNSPSGREVKND